MPSKREHDPNQEKPDDLSWRVKEESASVYEYYKRYLRNQHPDWSDAEIDANAQQYLSDYFHLNLVEAMMKSDEKIKQLYPEFEWTSWADVEDWRKSWHSRLEEFLPHWTPPKRD
jgi:hypothetical protein